MPFYNEEASLPALLERLQSLSQTAPFSIRFLFVDDGSVDHTPELLSRYVSTHEEAELMTHSENRGLGAAVNSMLTYAVAILGDEDVLVTMDGDDTHDPALALSLVDKLLSERLDLVIASRFVPGAGEFGVSWHRRLLSRGAGLFFKLFFPIAGVRDYSSGFRAYRLSLLRSALRRWPRLVTTDGFDSMAEVMAKLSRLAPRAGELPLILRYDQKRSKSKMRVLRTIGGYIRLLREAV